MYNVSLIKFKENNDKYGNLTAIEGNRNIPFEIKRVYYITKVSQDVIRGEHAHRLLHQILICLNGSVKVKVETPYEQEVYNLNSSSIGLYIGPMIWRTMYDFSESAVLMVLASEIFDESDYIRNYDFYTNEAKLVFDACNCYEKCHNGGDKNESSF